MKVIGGIGGISERRTFLGPLLSRVAKDPSSVIAAIDFFGRQGAVGSSRLLSR
jgi:hypothetical protein